MEKHRQEELKWGRESSDPFTGVLLRGAKHAPVYHTSLKERIDKWSEDPGGVICVGGRSVGVESSDPLAIQILNGNAKRFVKT